MIWKRSPPRHLAWHAEDLVLKRTLSAPVMPKEEPAGPGMGLFRQRDGTVEGWNWLEAFGSMVHKWGLKI